MEMSSGFLFQWIYGLHTEKLLIFLRLILYLDSLLNLLISSMSLLVEFVVSSKYNIMSSANIVSVPLFLFVLLLFPSLALLLWLGS